MNRLKYFIIIFILFVFLLSCAGDDPVYLFKDHLKVKLYKELDNNNAFYRFKKKEKIAVELSEADRYFKADIAFIKAPFFFRILLDNGDQDIDLSYGAISGKSSIFFKIPSGNTITGFMLGAEKGDLLPSLEKINRIEKNNYFSGIRNSDGVLLMGDTLQFKEKDGISSFVYNIPDSGSDCSEIIIDFDYISKNIDDEKIHIILNGKNEENLKFDYNPINGLNNIIINSSLFGFIPADIVFSVKTENIVLKNIYSDPFSCKEYNKDYFVPLKAGFGSILLSKKTSWRNDDFELFCWNYFPDFLIIDTSDYGFQARMFKRLAFYVEKPGSRGKILNNEDITDRHGWNAHDYKAEDLASFFTEAERLEFQLNQEEELLKKILLENNVIRLEAGKIFPGSGGILSVSRESSGYLRRVFISHEGYHGVFFSSPEFRKQCEIIWENVEPELKEFWMLFFDYKRYDTNDNYLLVNEFMAYNLQQPLNRVLPYYFDHIIPRLIKRYPEKEEFLNKIADEKGDRFLFHAEKIALSLQNLTSLPAGSLIFLNKSSEK